MKKNELTEQELAKISGGSEPVNELRFRGLLR
jgi:bacteriocin-like protein